VLRVSNVVWCKSRDWRLRFFHILSGGMPSSMTRARGERVSEKLAALLQRCLFSAC